MLGTPHESAEHFSELRRGLVEDLSVEGRIHDRRVLAAMTAVPREEFVPQKLRALAYTDQALPIACGQTISQPYTVAFMCQALKLRGGERVLEVGTGSGYGAAVLSLLADEVITVERIEFLASTAAERLANLGYHNVQVHTTDGTLGWPAGAPYDAIVVTAAAATLPPAYLEQVKEGGRIVMPVGRLASGQTMCRFTRRGDEAVVEELGSFAFVPLIGEQGWTTSQVAADKLRSPSRDRV